METRICENARYGQQKDILNHYCGVVVICYTIGTVFGITIACALLKNKSKRVECIESSQYGSIN